MISTFTVERVNSKTLNEVARFMARLNKKANMHVGYCGEDDQEVAHFLCHELSDVPYDESFVVAYQNGHIAGVAGFDADLENQRAEIWGPFVEDHDLERSRMLWNELLSIMPDDIHTFYLFPNKENHTMLQLAEELHCQHVSDECILGYEKKQLATNSSKPLELPISLYDDFQILHDNLFPSSYYEGSEILQRINEHQKVFVATEQSTLAGYVYVEVQPDFGEGAIEFIGVKNEYRGNRLGIKLLHEALSWMFSFDRLQTIELCVNSKNMRAIQLYKRAGFLIKHELSFFKGTIKRI
ncbi:GNAT family N-acetyltransferase [Priestia koreensis]|uniref:GNAT family N-acetyltransferase n=2 Tax=Priestia koreensis TaxID=284581 RepID=UPI003D0519C1